MRNELSDATGMLPCSQRGARGNCVMEDSLEAEARAQKDRVTSNTFMGVLNEASDPSVALMNLNRLVIT